MRLFILSAVPLWKNSPPQSDKYLYERTAGSLSVRQGLGLLTTTGVSSSRAPGTVPVAAGMTPEEAVASIEQSAEVESGAGTEGQRAPETGEGPTEDEG